MCPQCGGHGSEKMSSYGKLVCHECGFMFAGKPLIKGDDGDVEQLCEHGIGHGVGVHTCDGCCLKPGFYD
jgi:hypothetical protein